MSRKPWTSHAHKTRGSVYKPPVRWSGWYAQWSTVEKKRKAESDRFRSDYIAGQTIKLRYFYHFHYRHRYLHRYFHRHRHHHCCRHRRYHYHYHYRYHFHYHYYYHPIITVIFKNISFWGEGGGKSLEHLFSNRWMIARQGRQKDFSRVEKIKMNCKW